MGKIVKYCAACEEGFAAKFAFCPNCGGALEAYEMNPVTAPAPEKTNAEINEAATPAANAFTTPVAQAETPVAAEAKSYEPETAVFQTAPAETQEKILDDEYLAEETAAFTATASSDGNGFADRSHQSDFQTDEYHQSYAALADEREGFHVTVIEEKHSAERNALLLGAWLLVMTIAIGGVLYNLFSKDLYTAGVGDYELMSAMVVDDTPMEIEQDEPEQKKKDDAGGGGGGGREEPDPVSKGRLAPQTEKPLISPTKTIPQMDTELKMQAFTQGPERPVKVTNENYGDPNSTSYKLSDGTGRGGGQGSGVGTGQGSGFGTGAGSGRGSGMGSGIGDGIGDGTGSGRAVGDDDAPPPPKPTGPPTPVQILAKPKALYTDAARTNNVQGVVRVRVTLLASGQIGSVTPLNSLGYGLTEQALAAARQIKFKPATRGGVPVTVTKVFEYTFTMY